MVYISFINAYKQNSLAKKKYYYFRYIKKQLPLISKFLEIGLIKHIVKSNNLLKIYINYAGKNCIYTNLKILRTPSNHQNINYSSLIKKKEYKTNTTYLIFSTKGILTNFEAIHEKTGGILLCKINY